MRAERGPVKVTPEQMIEVRTLAPKLSARTWLCGNRREARDRLRQNRSTISRSPRQVHGQNPSSRLTGDFDTSTDDERPPQSVDLDETSGDERSGSGDEGPRHVDDCGYSLMSMCGRSFLDEKEKGLTTEEAGPGSGRDHRSEEGTLFARKMQRKSRDSEQK